MSAPVSAPLGSGEMFDGIAPRYDLLNRAMSLGLDRRWRRRLIRQLEVHPDLRVLDIATGTGDVAILAARAGGVVTGLDPSPRMLGIAAGKISAQHLSDRVALTEGSAESLPFADGAFERIAISFGIRNVPDRDRALREMNRVCVRGGRLAILELTEPRRGPLALLARFHVHQVVPRLGAALSGSREYRYLQQSIAAFPPPAEFASRMRLAGWRVSPQPQPLAFGACHLFLAEKE